VNQQANLTNSLPGSGDDVVINALNPGASVTHATSVADSINSLTSQAPIVLSGGSLSVGSSAMFGDLTLNGATLTGVGNITVSGAFNLESGTLGGTAGSSLTTEGNTTISGGTLDTRNLVNHGTATLTNTLSVQGAPNITNSAGATFGLRSPVPGNASAIVGSTSGVLPGDFYNAGTLTSESATGNAIGLAMHNTGTVAVHTGELDLLRSDAAGPISSGAITGDPGTVIGFSSAAVADDFTPGSTITADQVLFNGGNYLMEGSYRANATITVNGANVTFPASAPAPVVGNLSVDAAGSGGGTVAFDGLTPQVGSITVANNGTVDFSPAAGPTTLTLASLTLNHGNLTGANDIVVSGAFTWSGGTLSGPAGSSLTSKGSMTFNGGTLDTRSLVNDGSAVLTDSLALAGGASIDNLAGATFDLQSTNAVLNVGQGLAPHASTFDNAGLLTSEAGIYNALYMTLNNSGTVALNRGELDIGVNLSTGAITGAAGTFLVLGTIGPRGPGAALYTDRFAPGSSIAADRVMFEEGNYDVGAAYSANATAVGYHSPAIAATVTFSGAGLQLGNLTVVNGSTVDFSPSSSETISATSVDLSSGTLTGNSHVVLNDSGDYTQDSGSTLNLTLGGPAPGTGYDQINVSGAVSLAGGFNLNLAPHFTPRLHETFTVIQGQQPLSGTFAGLPEGSVITLGGNQFQISYAGNAVSLTAIAVANQPPSANAGGPYTMVYGAALSLDGSASSDPDGDPLSYSWTINGQANAATGVSPTLSWAQLQALGVRAAGQTYSVSVAVSDGTFVTSSSASTLTVSPAATTTTGAASTSSSFFGQAVTFTATVTANAPSTAIPGGSVDFYDTTTQTDLGSTTLSAAGTASLTPTAPLPVGNQIITESYAGNTDFLASSTTVTAPVSESIYVLNSSASGALSVLGNSSIHVGGLVMVDSKSSTALQANGNATITAAAIQVVGGVQAAGTGTLSPTPLTGATAVFDPEAKLPVPTVSNSQGSVNLSGTQALTINPGVYSAIKVSGSAQLTMNSGVYVIAGGGFTVTGNASVSGNGVLIYNAGSNYTTTGTGGNFGGITLAGNGTISLTAASTGTYAGVLIFQERDNNRAIALGGNGVTALSGGLIYAPQALVAVSGNAQLQHAPLIVGMLQLSGNAASTLTSGGDSSNSTAGQLLAGDLSVYVDNSNGYFTPAELAQIQDAINNTDALLLPYGVTVSEVSDPSLANLTLDSNTTSACGGMAQGVLGCFNMTTSEITLIQGWNWYAGSDPTAIGAGQYSFETTVTHELGHALGLGGSTDPNSPMYETLPTSVVKGGLAVADLSLPPLDTTYADALHAAGIPAPSGTASTLIPATVAVPATHSDAGSPANVRVTSVSPTSGLVPAATDTAGLANALTAAPSSGNLHGASLVASGQLLEASPMPSWNHGAEGYGVPEGMASPWSAGQAAGYPLEAEELVNATTPLANDPDMDGIVPATEEVPCTPVTPATLENEPASVVESSAAGAADPMAVDAVMEEFAAFQVGTAVGRDAPTSFNHEADGAARGWSLLSLAGGLALHPPVRANDIRRSNPRRGRIG
jgi:hypothetical protein